MFGAALSRGDETPAAVAPSPSELFSSPGELFSSPGRFVGGAPPAEPVARTLEVPAT